MCIYIVPGGVIVIFSLLFKLLNKEKKPKLVGRRMRSVTEKGQVPLRRMDGSMSAPTRISICALS